MKTNLFHLKAIPLLLCWLVVAFSGLVVSCDDREPDAPFASLEQKLLHDPFFRNYVVAYARLQAPPLSVMAQYGSRQQLQEYYVTLDQLMTRSRTPENMDTLAWHLGFDNTDSLKATFNTFSMFYDELDKGYPQLHNMDQQEKTQLFKRLGNKVELQDVMAVVLADQQVGYEEERGRRQVSSECLGRCYLTYGSCYNLEQSLWMLDKAYCSAAAAKLAPVECVIAAMADMVVTNKACSGQLSECVNQCNQAGKK